MKSNSIFHIMSRNTKTLPRAVFAMFTWFCFKLFTTDCTSDNLFATTWFIATFWRKICTLFVFQCWKFFAANRAYLGITSLLTIIISWAPMRTKFMMTILISSKFFSTHLADTLFSIQNCLFVSFQTFFRAVKITSYIISFKLSRQFSLSVLFIICVVRLLGLEMFLPLKFCCSSWFWKQQIMVLLPV